MVTKLRSNVDQSSPSERLGTVTLVLGGVRSGKSRYAQCLAAHLDEGRTPVVFVATASRSDDEMTRKIERHREDRPAHWQTIEEPLELARVINETDAEILLIDCLTLFASNLMHAVTQTSVDEPEQRLDEPEQRLHETEQRLNEPEQRLNEPEQRLDETEQRLHEPEQRSDETEQRIAAFCLALADARSRIILVSNEVGSGIVPAYPMGRQYRDLLGELNQRVARIADDVILMVAGLPLALKGHIEVMP